MKIPVRAKGDGLAANPAKSTLDMLNGEYLARRAETADPQCGLGLMYDSIGNGCRREAAAR